MSQRNKLLEAPPYPVEEALKHLGANLRTARLRRNLSIRDIAAKIGTGPRAVTDAEKGKVSTSIGVYVALLWVMDLVSNLNQVADPTRDIEGQALELSKERSRARHTRDADDDF